MSEIITNDLRNLMKETEINNTFDIESVGIADKYTLENSWAYLARVQRNTIHFEKYYFPTSRASSESIQYGDLFLDNRYRVCMRINEDIIRHTARDIFYAERNDHKVKLTNQNIKSYYFKYIVEKDGTGNEILVMLEPNGYQSNQITNSFDKIHGNEDDYIGRTVTIRYPMYKNEFTLRDINDNQDIFARLPLVYLKTGYDRKYLLEEMTFRIDNGDLILIFPYQTNFLYDKHNGLIQHEVSVLFVDNSEYVSTTTNTRTIKKTTEIDDTTLTTYEIYSTSFGLQKFRTDGTYMVFVKFNGNDGESLWFPSVVINDHKTLLRIDFGAFSETINNASGNYTLYLVFAKDMYEYVLKNESETFSVRNSNRIAEKSAPIALINPEDGVNFPCSIPKENTLIIKCIRDGSSFNGQYEYEYRVDTEVHYPNMYKITDPDMELGDLYRFFYFYNDEKIGMRYKNRFQYFYRYLRKKLEQNTIEDAVNVAYFGKASVIDDLVVEHLTRTEFNNLVAVFMKLWNFTPYEYQYDLIDYVKYYSGDEYGLVTADDDQVYTHYNNDLLPIGTNIGSDTPYQYKVDRLKDFINRNTEALKDYVKIQNKTSEVYYMFAKMINLEKRLRTDTSNEIKNSFIEFDKPHYIFTFQHSDKTEEPVIHIWVDGLLTMNNKVIEENGIYFIYVPADEITEDSYLELEVRHSFALTDTNLYFSSTSMDDAYTVIINNPDDVTPTLSDLMFFYYNPTTGIIGEEIPINNFEIYRARYEYWQQCSSVDPDAMIVVNDEDYNPNEDNPPQVRISTVRKEIQYITAGSFVKKSHKVVVSSLDGNMTKKVDFMPIDVIKIRASKSEVLHKNIALKIRKNAIYRDIHAKSIRYPAINIDSKFDVKFDPEYYHVYRNGRLIPKSMFVVKGEGTSNRRIQALFEMKKGDTIAFDALPFKTELVYKTDVVPPHAIIHLVDENGEPLLDKPFDIRYYDVYLNGRKLNETQCFGVGDTYLHILNTHSMKNLEIYSRDRDEEYFGWHKHKYTWWFGTDNFRIDELIDENRDSSLAFVTDDDRHWIIDDIIQGFIDDEGLSDYVPMEEPDDTEEDNVEEIEYDDMLKCKIFYYEELLPTRLAIATESQFEDSYILAEYEPIHNTYMINGSPIARAANARTRGLLFASLNILHLDENVLYMDPDINVTTASTVFMMGDYDDVCKELENTN